MKMFKVKLIRSVCVCSFLTIEPYKSMKNYRFILCACTQNDHTQLLIFAVAADR